MSEQVAHLPFNQEAVSSPDEREAVILDFPSSVLHETDGRPPKITAEEAEFALASGPYIGRVAAQETLLAYANKLQARGGYRGIELPDNVISGIKIQLAVRRRALTRFTNRWPEMHSIGLQAAEMSRAEESATTTTISESVPKVTTRVMLPTVHPVPKPRIKMAERLEPATESELLQLVGLQADPAAEMDWESKALCAQTDPEAFFPEKGGSTREAKKVCLECNVRADCLEDALGRDDRFGIWGGLSERERRKLKKRSR